MVQIPLSDELFEQVKKATPPSMPPETFVTEIIREKLALDERRKEFYRLSDRARVALRKRGLSEQAILEEFESFRKKLL